MTAKAKKAASGSEYAVGDRVKFPSSHNKALELVGRIVKVHESGDAVDIECDVDGKIIEVEGHIQTVPVSELKDAAEGDKHRHVGDGSK
jgi:hypothetical protein